MSAVGGRPDVTATWPEQPLVAEFVEKVGAVRFSATIVLIS